LRRHGGSRAAPYKAAFGLLFSSAMLVLMIFMIEQPFSAAGAMAKETQCCNQVK
jgi:homospermidine synthase